MKAAPIVLVAGQVWHSQAGDTRTVLKVFPKDERGDAPVRVQIGDGRVTVIANRTLRAWIGQERAVRDV